MEALPPPWPFSSSELPEAVRTPTKEPRARTTLPIIAEKLPKSEASHDLEERATSSQTKQKIVPEPEIHLLPPPPYETPLVAAPLAEPESDFDDMVTENVPEKPKENVHEITLEIIQEKDNEDISEIANDNVPETVNQNVPETVDETVRDIAKETLQEKPQVLEAANENVQETPNENVQEKVSENVPEAANENVQVTAIENVLEKVNTNVQKTVKERNEVLLPNSELQINPLISKESECLEKEDVERQQEPSLPLLKDVPASASLGHRDDW